MEASSHNQASTSKQGVLCSKCGKPGEFRAGHRQCRVCERAYGRANNAKNKDHYAAYREVHRERYRKLNVEGTRRRRIERHMAIDKLKSAPCADCGVSYPPYVMDFDHRDPSNKSAEINHLINKTCAPWSRILEEVTKCDVVCVCCHRLRTWNTPKKALDNRRKLIISLKDVPCADCGDTFHYSQMDFDHVHGEKVREVPLLKNKAAILKEAAKCDVVCANCHRERSHAKQGTLRVDPASVDMVWKVRRSDSVQTEVISYRKPLETPAYREWHSLAGKMTDVEVSRRTGVSQVSVCVYRKKMGIPRFKPVRFRESRKSIDSVLDTKAVEIQEISGFKQSGQMEYV